MFVLNQFFKPSSLAAVWKTERRRLSEVANIAEQIHFVGNKATSLLHLDDGAWPSGKAPGFGPGIREFESLRPSQSSFSLFSSVMSVWLFRLSCNLLFIL
jgi:hypothetical protein